jgi:hypothetical protein
VGWDNNLAIRIRLGQVALWNLLNRRVIDLRDPTLQMIKNSFERMSGVQAGIQDEFADMVSRPLPSTAEVRRLQEEMYVRKVKS